MAATAKGVQTKSAEQMNQERRSAKARQHAVRKARAAAEEKKQKNYSAGFKFVSNESRREVVERQIEKEKKEFLDASNRIFNQWMKQLLEGKTIQINLLIVQSERIQIHAHGRLMDVIMGFPEKYASIVRGNTQIVSPIRKA